tara:strand:- start:152 stop:790 length:639 start_codon:yes stop_codon:yes gene_type:complete
MPGISKRVKKIPDRYSPSYDIKTPQKKTERRKQKLKKSSSRSNDMVIRNSSNSSNSSNNSSSQKVNIILTENERIYKPTKTIKKRTQGKTQKKENNIIAFNWGKKGNEIKQIRAKRLEIYNIISDPIKYKQHIKKTILFNIKIIGPNPNINDDDTLQSLLRGTVINNNCVKTCRNNIKELTLGILANVEGELDLTNKPKLDDFVNIVYNNIT